MNQSQNTGLNFRTQISTGHRERVDYYNGFSAWISHAVNPSAIIIQIKNSPAALEDLCSANFSGAFYM